MRWSRLFGQLEGFIKVYSGCESCPRGLRPPCRRATAPGGTAPVVADDEPDPAPGGAQRNGRPRSCPMRDDQDDNALWDCGNLAAGMQASATAIAREISNGLWAPAAPPCGTGAMPRGRPQAGQAHSAPRGYATPSDPAGAAATTRGAKGNLPARQVRVRLRVEPAAPARDVSSSTLHGNGRSNSAAGKAGTRQPTPAPPRPAVRRVTPPAPRHTLRPACVRPTPSADARGCRTSSTPQSPARPRTRRAIREDTPPRTSATATAVR